MQIWQVLLTCTEPQGISRFFENMETEFRALFITLKWNSTAVGKCQNKHSILKKQYKHSNTNKEIPVAKFNNDEWMCELPV